MADSSHALRGRIGAYGKWAREANRTEATKPARDKFMERFAAFPDPGAARKAYFARLAYQSAKARKARKRGSQ